MQFCPLRKSQFDVGARRLAANSMRTQARRVSRVLFWLAAVGVLSGCLGCAVGSEALRVRLAAMRVDPGQPQRTRFGALTLLSSFALKANDERFGGLSGLALDASGGTLFAVSDHGYGLSARLRHDASGRLTGVEGWTIEPLQTPQGEPVAGQLRDAEALVLESDGAWLVAFEQQHRIWRYPPAPTAFTAAPEALALPRTMSQAPVNGGIEGMTRLPDGRLLALTEKMRHADGGLQGWLLGGGRAASVSYRDADGFAPTDLAALSQGDVLVLERRFRLASGVAARLRCIPAAQLRPGGRLQGRELAHFQAPLVVDNFEGLAVRERSPEDVILYVISDNNYNFFQQTLLYQFRLRPPDCR